MLTIAVDHRPLTGLRGDLARMNVRSPPRVKATFPLRFGPARRWK